MFRFTNLEIFNEAKRLHIEIVKSTKRFNSDFRYLKDQVRRFSLSVALNIAEGSGKSSKKEFKRYLENSLGSLNETAASLIIATSLGLLSKNRCGKLYKDYETLRNRIGALSRKLKSES